MSVKRFYIHEIEHQGDEDDAIRGLSRAGCTKIKVLRRDYQECECEESIAVECELPEGMTLRQLERKAEVCL
jgi:hypothetical protein